MILVRGSLSLPWLKVKTKGTCHRTSAVCRELGACAGGGLGWAKAGVPRVHCNTLGRQGTRPGALCGCPQRPLLPLLPPPSWTSQSLMGFESCHLGSYPIKTSCRIGGLRTTHVPWIVMVISWLCSAAALVLPLCSSECTKQTTPGSWTYCGDTSCPSAS